MKDLVQLLAAFIGSLGFVLLFNVRGSKALPAGVGGLLSWGIYLLAGLFTPLEAVRILLATVVLTVYAELMAKIKKAPATLFLVPGTIPLIPGASLYSAMYYAVRGNWEEFSTQGMKTMVLALAIAMGILFTMSVFGTARKIWQELKHKR